MQSHYTMATMVDFVEAGGVAPSSRAYHARALLLSYTSVGQGGWICPSGLRFPKPALIYPSSPLMSALVWNRTSSSWFSARRHHQIGYKGIVVAGVVPGHGHRRLFGFQRARSLRNKAVRGRGFEPRRAGSKPAGLPLADPRSARFRDQDSNLGCC